MSTAAADRTPITFGQRSPSPTPVSNNAESPTSDDHYIPPHFTATAAEAEDIDMSTSITLPPRGQNHDREAQMDGIVADAGNSTSQATHPPAQNTGDANTTVDMMDTAPDSSTLPQSESTDDAIIPAPPNPELASDTTRPGEVFAISIDENGTVTETRTELPPPSIVAASQIPANLLVGETNPTIPPPIHPQHDIDSSSDSDDDEPRRRWHEIREDTSSPDENELKDIERRGETSALDHAHWEAQTYTEFEDPEFTPGVSGRIEWTIEHYNGTKEAPNKEIVMRSQEVKIGEHNWRIKFYPRGNDTEFLSVYIECLTLNAPTQPECGSSANKADEPANIRKPRSTPLPLISGTEAPSARQSLLAQIAVVLYNPSEPRVNHYHNAVHRFSPGSPDWGWTRFHGPYYEIQSRMHGQRAALLRDDKLALTAYIRVVEDETGVHGEHDDSTKQKWDSFVMTGLQGLTASQISSSANPGGNLISAVASWILLKPFREILYQVHAPDPENEPRRRPKPMLRALQAVVYGMRTQVYEKAPPVLLEVVTDALEWYGIDEDVTKLDVMQIWEILRSRLEIELIGTPYEHRLAEIFGQKRDRSRPSPTYKVGVKGSEILQEAIEESENFLPQKQTLPLVLQVQLDRQDFDEETRTWRKLVNRVQMDDHVDIHGAGYTLFGFIAHKESLQSGLFYPVLRPEGPDGKWYKYTDAKDNNKVTILTKREALKVHEGYPAAKCNDNESASIAYVVLYVKDDIATTIFDKDEPVWDVPPGLIEDVERARARDAAIERSIFAFDPPPPPPTLDPLGDAQNTPLPPPPPPLDEKPDEPVRDVVFQVFDSRLFLEHEGPGILDPYLETYATDSQYVFTLHAKSNTTLRELRTKIAEAAQGVEDERQCKYWIMDALSGTIDKPQILGVGNAEMSCGRENITNSLDDILEPRVGELRLWLHVMDIKDVPTLPKEDNKDDKSVQTSSTVGDGPPNTAGTGQSSNTEQGTNIANEDTLMSDAEEGDSDVHVAVDPVVESPGITFLIAPPATGESPFPAPPPFPFSADTEMGGVSDVIPPPPLPSNNGTGTRTTPGQLPSLRNNLGGILTAADIAGELGLGWVQTPPPPPPASKSADDLVYFFLKLFDPEKQRLECKGSYIAKHSARVDNTVLGILKLPDDTQLNYFEEEDIITANPIRRRRSFSHEDIHNAHIVIVQHPISDELAAEYMEQGKCPDPQSFLQCASNLRNFPEYTSGTFILDFFSSEYYSGDIRYCQPNGHGSRISHDNTKYTGTFVQGARHGKGHLTYANGDVYEGDFLQGLPHGSGKFTELATANVYEGGWKAGKKHGEGVTHWKVAQEAERVCRICWEEEADSAFWDCGHVVACIGCARRVDICPVCRRRVLGTCKLFYVS